MLSNSMVEEIRRLLEEGKLSQREISKRLQVSRGTITSVSMDRRRERVPREEDEEEVDLGPPARCATCGGLVYLPCRLCRVRAAKYGPRGERSLLSSDMRPSTFGGPNERRSCARSPSEVIQGKRGHGERNPAPRDASSSARPDRNARLPGR